MAQSKNGQGMFSADSPLMSGLGRLTMILVTAFLWTLTSLPVITVGASSSAVFYVMLKTQRGEEGNYISDYFRAFRENFKQATLAWVILLAAGCLFGFCIFYYNVIDSGISQWIMFIFGALLVLDLIVMMYVFPILSRFANSLKVIMTMALVLPFQNLKRTVVLVLIAAAMTLICVYFSPLIFFGYGLFAFIASYIFPKIFKPLEEAIDAKNETGVD